jgi:hypothetical protein
MAEVIGLISSIATLLELIVGIGRSLRMARDLLGEAPLIANLSDEVQGTAVVLSELQIILQSFPRDEDTQDTLRRSQLELHIDSAQKHLTYLQDIFAKINIDGQTKLQRAWTKLRYQHEASRFQAHVRTMQHQKLTLLICLSGLTL